ncbi:hypothetical protein FQN60_005943, partial [Etheostoma spectabile]
MCRLLCVLFGVTGNCAACSKLIPAFEMVMRAKENVYHLDCFACQLCNQRYLGSVPTLNSAVLTSKEVKRSPPPQVNTGTAASRPCLTCTQREISSPRDRAESYCSYALNIISTWHCAERFCVGDKFFLKNNMILCQTDYEEGLMKEGYAPQ